MTLLEAIAEALIAAEAEGKSPAEVCQLLIQEADAQCLDALKGDLESLTVSAPDAQWQAIRQTLRAGRDIPDRREFALLRIAAAVRQDNQAEFWRAAVALLVMVRASLPHLEGEFG